MLPEGPQKRLVDAVSEKLHSDQYFPAAKLVADWFGKQTGKKIPTTTKKHADEILTLLLQWCLANGGYEEAAQLLWGPMLFDPRPGFTKRIWDAFEKNKLILLMGSGSCSKSFSMGVRLFLEWLRDPKYTTVRVLGPSEKHLEDNLFSHLVTLHQQSSIPLPGLIGKLFIGLDPRARKSSISGVVIPLGQKKAAKFQGTKRVNRKTPHPEFGNLSRMFIFLDEICNIPNGIWRDIDNLMTGMGDGTQKIIGAFNPTEREDEVGVRCEPKKSWAMFDPNEDFEWESKRGWHVVRLDALQCENVKQKRVIYPGLQTYEGLQLLIQNSGGMDSPGYWAMGRGCFPPTGVPMSIIPQGMLDGLKCDPFWYETPIPCGGVDLALEGGDVAVFIKGSFGLASGIRCPPSLQFPAGQSLMFKDKGGRNSPRYLLLAETLIAMPKGDTVAIKSEVIRLARGFGIRPDWLAVDRTGNGQGVHDLIRFEWGEIIGVNFFEGAEEVRIMAEDIENCRESYDRMNSQLWFCTRKWIEFGYCKLSIGFPTEAIFPQLAGRLYKSQGRKSHVEKKPEYASRNAGKSPNEADAFTLLIHAARKASGLVAGMSAENSGEISQGDEYGDGDARCDCTNRFEDL